MAFTPASCFRSVLASEAARVFRANITDTPSPTNEINAPIQHDVINAGNEWQISNAEVETMVPMRLNDMMTPRPKREYPSGKVRGIKPLQYARPAGKKAAYTAARTTSMMPRFDDTSPSSASAMSHHGEAANKQRATASTVWQEHRGIRPSAPKKRLITTLPSAALRPAQPSNPTICGPKGIDEHRDCEPGPDSRSNEVQTKGNDGD